MTRSSRLIHWLAIAALFLFCFQLAKPVSICPPAAFAYDEDDKDHGHTGPDGADPNATGPQDEPNPASGADPIQLKSGNYTFAQKDLQLQGVGEPVVLKRHYHSFDLDDGPLGRGWSHSFDVRVTEISSGDVVVRGGDGIRYRFTRNADGTYQSPRGRYLTLVKHGEGAFTLWTKHRVASAFLNGRLGTITDPNGNQTTLDYAPDGKLVKVTNPSGRWISFTYGANHKLAAAADHTGRTVTYQYDANDLLIGVTNPLGDTRSFTYDENHRMVTNRDAKGEVLIQNTYDAGGKVIEQFALGGTFHAEYFDGYTTVTDREGKVSTHYYNDPGNPTRIIDALGHETVYTWNEALQLTAVTDANGRTTQYGYDQNGNVTTVTDPLGNVTQLTYDSTYSRVTSVTDPLDRTATFLYDALGNLIQATDPLGNIHSIDNNGYGQPVRVTDPAGAETLFTYNDAGDLLTITDPEGNVTQFEPDAAGRITRRTDPLGNAAVFGYDVLDHLTGFTAPSGEAFTIAYDEVGNITGVTDPFGNTMAYQYDAFHKLTRQTDPLGNVTAWGYDLNDRLTSVTDALSRQTLFDYDDAGRMTLATRADQTSIGYGYDPAGNLLSLTDGKGSATQFQYDENNRLVGETRPLGQETAHIYDAAGQLVEEQDAKGQRALYTYDAAGRLIRIEYLGAAGVLQKTVHLSYDARGNLLSYDDGTTTGAFTYDAMGRKLTETIDYGPFTLSHSYTYDANGQKTSITYPDGTVYPCTYDANGRLTGVGIPGGSAITWPSYRWTAPTAKTFPGGTCDFSYDPLLRVQSITSRDASQNPILAYQYTYDALGNAVLKSTGSGDEAYAYDSLYRLSGADHPTLADEAYTYDAADNRLTAAHTTGDWLYNANNELLEYSDPTLTQGIALELVYNIEDRVESVKGPRGNVIATYCYDPFGRRLWKEVSGVRTYFVYSDEGLIGEYDASGNELKAYGYKPGCLWGTGPLFMETGGAYYFYHNDHLGTPQKLTAADGQVVWSARYASFGKVVLDVAAVENPLRFPGQYFDAETGLHYNWQRYYDPEVGRYLTADPIGFEGGINLYAYVIGNPVNLVDPFGLASITVHVNTGSGFFSSTNSNAGHAWVTIRNDDGTQSTIGNYPGGPIDDSNRVATESYTFYNVSQVDAYAALQAVREPGYAYTSDNCADRVSDALDAAGINHPDFKTLGVDTPNNIYYWIHNINTNVRIP